MEWRFEMISFGEIKSRGPDCRPPRRAAWRGWMCCLLGTAALLAWSGCSHRDSTAAVASDPAPEWNWDFYPPLERMRLAVLPCQLLPKSSIAIHSPLVGVLRVYVTQPQTNLPAGFVWGEFEPAIFAAEAAALEEARVKLEERERLQLELELPKQKLRMERELEEARRQVDFLNILSTNKEYAQMAFRFPSTMGNPLKPETLEKARLELDLLEQSLEYLESTNLMILGIDLPGEWSEWRRRRLEFERRQAQARLKMPFTGQLTIGLPLTEGVVEYPVNTGQEVAVARDLSTVRVRVALSHPAWAGLPPERLSAVVRIPGGAELRGTFVVRKIERVQNREESVYYFQLPPEQAEMAARLLGTDVACELWYELPQPAHVVPKLNLVLNRGGAFQGRDWASGVAAAWPGAVMLVEGQTDVAIVRPQMAAKR